MHYKKFRLVWFVAIGALVSESPEYARECVCVFMLDTVPGSKGGPIFGGIMGGRQTSGKWIVGSLSLSIHLSLFPGCY